MKNLNFILIISLAIALGACAVQKSPLGGPKDENPPMIDSLKSTINYQTFFEQEEIVLKFDEFVQLKNVFEQVVYSPPLKVKPELTQRGKKIELKFSEEDTLRANTTYTINFGDAIQDFNESNILSNYRFVFSTGAIIDSLEIFGNVMDDQTRKPAEEVLVLLYDNLEDSIVYKEQPYYFAKTDKSGNFEIQNLRSDTFKVIVLNDGNLNLKYDEGEAIGFLDSFIYIIDSLPGKLQLNIFEPVLDLVLVDSESYPFKIALEFNRPPNNLTIRSTSDSLWWEEEILLDSMLLWHDNTVVSDSLIIMADGIVLDTLLYNMKKPKTSIDNITFKKKNTTRSKLLKTGETFTLEFPYPIVNIDSSKIEFEDSLNITGFELKVDTSNARKLQLNYDYRYGDTLNLQLLPSALSFINGAINDTISELILPDNPEKLGTLNISIDSLNQDEQYVFQLLDGDKVVKEEIISNKLLANYTYRNMDPKQYIVKLILDENRNGKWDPGNYMLKTQSELWKVFNIEKLRENWELEANVNWKQ